MSVIDWILAVFCFSILTGAAIVIIGSEVAELWSSVRYSRRNRRRN